MALTLVANATPNNNTNSHKTATGKFLYTVEPPLTISTITRTQDLGAVCPNCTVNFRVPKCLEWSIGGGKTCNVKVTITQTTPPETGVTIVTTTEYNDQNNSNNGFETFPGEHADGNGGVWHIGNNHLKYRVCASSIAAANYASAIHNGTNVWTIVGDYTNDIAPHM